jgi:hypothetical protein
MENSQEWFSIQPTNNPNTANQDQNKGEQHTVDNLVEKSNTELARVKTVFPFKLFPTEIVVDEVKVTIISHMLFTKHLFPINIKDLKAVTILRGPFFASMKFEIAGYEDNPGVIKLLNKNDAIKAHKIIVGLTIVDKLKADKDLDSLSETEKKAERLEIIGSSETAPTT